MQDLTNVGKTNQASPPANTAPSTIAERLRRSSKNEYVVITALSDGSGAIVLRPAEDFGLHNAEILDQDGKTRAVVQAPFELQNGLGFADAYYVQGELIAILVVGGRDFAVVVDEKSGKPTRWYETR